MTNNINSTNRPNNQPTPPMTRVQALTLAIQAISYFLTGLPTKEAFDRKTTEAAWQVLVQLHNVYPKNPEHRALLTANKALQSLIWDWRHRGLSNKKLEEAREIIPQLLEIAQEEEEAYWQSFTQWALAEADQIIEAAQDGFAEQGR